MAYYVSYYANNGFGPITNTGTFHSKAQASKRASELRKAAPKSTPVVLKASSAAKRKNPAGVPIGKWIKATKVRMNRNGTVTVSVPSRRPATKRKRR